MRVLSWRDRRITRLVQPAGSRKRPPTWSDGVCVRLPRGRVVLVDFHLPREGAERRMRGAS